MRVLHVILTDPSFLELSRAAYGFEPDEPVSINRAEQAAKERLDRFAAQNLGEIPHESAVAVGYDLASAILEDEKGWKPDVITMGTAGRRGRNDCAQWQTTQWIGGGSVVSAPPMRWADASC